MENLDKQIVKDGFMCLRAFNHKLRQEILDLIKSNEKTSVTELYKKMELEQSVASQHLAILRKTGVVKTIRDGKFVYYQFNQERYNQILDAAKVLA